MILDAGMVSTIATIATLDTGMATVAAATIAATIAAAGAFLNTAVIVKQNRKVSETHKQVTVNHHSSDSPTVLDRIDTMQASILDLAADFNRHRGDFNDHVSHSNEMDLRVIKIEVAKETERELRLLKAESED